MTSKITNSDTDTTVSVPKDAARRNVIEGGGAGAIAAVLGLVAIACGDDSVTGGSGGTAPEGGNGAGDPQGGEPSDGGGGSTSTMMQADNDIEPLNALLTAEYLAIAAYTAGAGIISNAPETDPLFAVKDVIVAVGVDFVGHHTLHAAALVDAINELDGTPVDQQTVADTFMPPAALVANPTITNVLKFAASAERAAAVAYNQVLAGLESSKYRFLATAIEGDESQHFIVLAALVLGLAGPGPALNTTTAADVVPEAFVFTVGAEDGLNDSPADYFP